MWEDPIVEEVRRARALLAAKYDYDLHRYADDVRNRPDPPGHKTVSYPPRLPAPLGREAPNTGTPPPSAN